MSTRALMESLQQTGDVTFHRPPVDSDLQNCELWGRRRVALGRVEVGWEVVRGTPGHSHDGGDIERAAEAVQPEVRLARVEVRGQRAPPPPHL